MEFLEVFENIAAMKKFFAAIFVFITLLFPASAMAANIVDNGRVSVQDILPVNNSSANGLVVLNQLANNGGTRIHVVGFGLMPNHQYTSLYYDNHVCALEPYSASDVIATYTTGNGGIAAVRNNVTDNLNQINSVSIRDAKTFQLIACANVHP